MGSRHARQHMGEPSAKVQTSRYLTPLGLGLGDVCGDRFAGDGVPIMDAKAVAATLTASSSEARSMFGGCDRVPRAKVCLRPRPTSSKQTVAISKQQHSQQRASDALVQKHCQRQACRGAFRVEAVRCLFCAETARVQCHYRQIVQELLRRANRFQIMHHSHR